MTDFGYNTIGASNDNPADNWVWCKATATPASSGTLTAITAYCQQGPGQVGGGSTMDCAIYSDSSGAPGSLLAAGATPVSVSSSFAWVTQSGFSLAITSGVQYWFCIRCPAYTGGNNDLNVKFDTNGGATELYFRSPGTGSSGAFPASAGSPSSATNERWSIYGTYTPGGGAPAIVLGPSKRTDPWKVGRVWVALR